MKSKDLIVTITFVCYGTNYGAVLTEIENRLGEFTPSDVDLKSDEPGAFTCVVKVPFPRTSFSKATATVKLEALIVGKGPRFETFAATVKGVRCS